MSVDTDLKRRMASAAVLPFLIPGVLPSGGSTAEWRYAAGWSYSESVTAPEGKVFWRGSSDAFVTFSGSSDALVSWTGTTDASVSFVGSE